MCLAHMDITYIITMICGSICFVLFRYTLRKNRVMPCICQAICSLIHRAVSRLRPALRRAHDYARSAGTSHMHVLLWFSAASYLYAAACLCSCTLLSCPCSPCTVLYASIYAYIHASICCRSVCLYAAGEAVCAALDGLCRAVRKLHGAGGAHGYLDVQGEYGAVQRPAG